MTVHVKICGITDSRAASAAVEAGADAIGFVFSPSIRQLAPEEATAIASGFDDVQRVAVFRDASEEQIMQVLGLFPADLVQANHRSLADLTLPVPSVPVFRESVDSAAAVGAWQREHDGRFLYEGAESGVGKLVDWRAANRLARLGDMSLAGGLSADNVADAIVAVRPFGVDVSSGVESEPGVKDPVLIRRFVEAARSGGMEERAR